MKRLIPFLIDLEFLDLILMITNISCLNIGGKGMKRITEMERKIK